ncbi:MAG: dihydroxy-acid dehydratase, partial [Terriglobus roseus]|nr:dihydroxy-acid dehydratase [Terriglobus roseus]
MSNEKPSTLRSQQWFGRQDKNGFYYRSWLKNRGFPQDQFDGRPVIGICNTWSELTPCNTHFKTLADHVRCGVLEAGGFPLEFPAMSPGETLTRPSAMLYRNLAAMEVEESIRSNPLDGVVLLMGCDKTTPSLLMGAASVDIPTIGISAGPMLRGVYRGAYIGSGTNTISMSEQLRAGEITLDEYHEAEACMHRSHGTCMTMGTASTMACMVESLGISLPGNAAIPAVDARRNLLSRESGRRIVDMVRQNITMSKIITRESLENAIRVNAAIGGSTNAVIHHIALARRMNLDMSLDDWDNFGRNVPCLLNIMPQGNFLMEDFFEAGGLPAIIRQLGEHNLLHRDALTANGKTIWQNNESAPNWRPEVIHTFEEPFKPVGGIAVLKGNLAPSGSVLKPSAASDALTRHTGPAVVFETIEDLRARINDDDLEIDE